MQINIRDVLTSACACLWGGTANLSFCEMAGSAFIVKVLVLQLRDGRQLKKEGRAKNIMCMNRFLQKGTGLLGRSMDNSLENLGLGSICPSHHQRLL